MNLGGDYHVCILLPCNKDFNRFLDCAPVLSCTRTNVNACTSESKNGGSARNDGRKRIVLRVTEESGLCLG